VLTNSIATSDMMASLACYRRYRRALLENDVEAHELRSELGTQRDFWSLIANDSTAISHSKVGVCDRKVAFVVSFNFDLQVAEKKCTPEAAGKSGRGGAKVYR
jgi:phosphatidylserine/phosphatidylglycerophosphate/cardiolipin synthase-like enzyme